jgi:hypothetical protein
MKPFSAYEKMNRRELVAALESLAETLRHQSALKDDVRWLEGALRRRRATPVDTEALFITTRGAPQPETVFAYHRRGPVGDRRDFGCLRHVQRNRQVCRPGLLPL